MNVFVLAEPDDASSRVVGIFAERAEAEARRWEYTKKHPGCYYEVEKWDVKLPEEICPRRIFDETD